MRKECQWPPIHIPYTTKIIKWLRGASTAKTENPIWFQSKKKSISRTVHLLLGKFYSLNFTLAAVSKFALQSPFCAVRIGIRYCLCFGRLKICIINSTWFHHVFKECGRLSLSYTPTRSQSRNIETNATHQNPE